MIKKHTLSVDHSAVNSMVKVKVFFVLPDLSGPLSGAAAVISHSMPLCMPQFHLCGGCSCIVKGH